ncbi:MAG TPA: tetratricopeptide repeat protein [Bacillota bacterium]|nr:tetratricopeptide repeat protein [Bacillota bacterium]
MDTITKAAKLMEKNQTDEAIALLEDYSSVADDEEKFMIVELYHQWGYIQKAIDLLQALEKKYPMESDIKIMLADMLIEIERDEAAIELLDQVKEDDEAYVQALVQLADLYQAQGLFEVAEQKLLLAKRKEPNEIIIDFALGELLFSIGEYQRAITYYERILPHESQVANVAIYDRLAEAYAATGKYEDALQIFRMSDNKNPDTLFKYGLTAFQANRNDIAIKAWEQVLKIDPYYHTVYLYLAKAYANEKMPDKAYDIAKKGLSVDEFNKELYFIAGKLAYTLRRYDESKDFVRKAVALDPDYKEGVLFLIELFKEEEKFADIIDLINEIQQSGAQDPLYEWELARAHREIESYADALKHYREAYNTLNKDSDFLKEYAYFLVEEGRMDAAIPVFESYLQLEPLDSETEEYLARLKQFQDDE